MRKATKETWKQITHFGCGDYYISNIGRVKSTKLVNEAILVPKNNGGGYMQVILCENGKQKYEYVHRLVAMYFSDDYFDGCEIHHKNLVKTDNRIENLECLNCNEHRTFHRTHHSLEGSKTTKAPKKVIAIDPITGEVELVFDSSYKAGKFGYNQGWVSALCKGTREGTYKGYIWMFETDYETNK